MVNYNLSPDGLHMIATYKGEDYHLDYGESLDLSEYEAEDTLADNPVAPIKDIWDAIGHKSTKIILLNKHLINGDKINGYVVTNYHGNRFPSNKGITMYYENTRFFRYYEDAVNSANHSSDMFQAKKVYITKKDGHLLLWFNN